MTHRVHMISFHRIGESSYATLHPGQERMQPWQWKLLKELLDANATQPVEDDAESFV